MRTFALINPKAYAAHALRLLVYKGTILTGVIFDFAFLSVFTGLVLIVIPHVQKKPLVSM